MIDTLLAARLLMAISLGFHIIIASISMILPFLMYTAYIKHKKTKDPEYLTLSKFWIKGTAVLFAIGAVSGTILSFELGLLWPEFMKHAGPIIGMPFSLEGGAFFIEAIAIGFFIYGWDKLPSPLHNFFGLLVGIMGICSGVLVISANGWMNAPTGFDYINGTFTNIDPIKAMLNPSWIPQSIHMIAAAGQATCFLVAGIHASLLLKNKNRSLHLKAFKIAIIPACIISLLLPITGDTLAKGAAERQPIKFAAMEGHFHTEKGAPFVIGGIPNEKDASLKYAIKIPKLLSFLTHYDLNAEIKGLLEFDRSLWPPVLIVHTAFQIMIGIGTFLMILSIYLLYLLYKKSPNITHPRLLKLLFLICPLGFIALESGWIVTEVGRQPWIIYNILKTKEAVTPVVGIKYYLYLFLFIYTLLGITVIWFMNRLFKASLDE